MNWMDSEGKWMIVLWALNVVLGAVKIIKLKYRKHLWFWNDFQIIIFHSILINNNSNIIKKKYKEKNLHSIVWDKSDKLIKTIEIMVY